MFIYSGDTINKKRRDFEQWMVTRDATVHLDFGIRIGHD